MHTKYLTCCKGAFYISLIYFISAALWIILSDYAVGLVVENTDEVILIGMYKGVFFVLATTIVLYFLTYKFFRSMQSQYDKNLEHIAKHQDTKQSLKDSQSELAKNDTLLKSIVNSSPDAIYAKDLEGKYILFNEAAAKMVNADIQNVLGKSDEEIFDIEDAKKVQIADKETAFSAKVSTIERTLTMKDGSVKTVLATKGPLVDEQNSVFGIFGISRDITSQKEHERFLEESKEKFYNLSYQDKVTNLPNRLKISEVLVEKCSQEIPFCLILLDLDEFKIVNDSYGHRFGDKLLFEVSKVLVEVFDSTAFIARMGGDEFAIALNQSDKKEIEALMQKLHAKFSNPFKIDMVKVYITASSGISIYPDDVQSMEEMYQASDTAMYNAKKLGKNSFSFYDVEFKKEAVAHTQMVTNLKQAVQKHELELYFQPQNEASSGNIVGIEALLRWKHKDMMISPDVFIPLAEQSSLIVEIGNFVIKSGFEVAKRWHERGILRNRLSINISARQLTHLEFIVTLKNMLRESGCEASWIELEITESSVLENPELVISLLEQIRALGFYISMDDFGTGYSSLSYLKNLPIDKLKIDRSFIMNIREQPKNQIIVKTVIFLAKELGIHILAEGVETEEEHSFLLENKIDSIQGYYYAKPMPLDEMERLLF
ncbi:MAG: EAL domain-containing protein [Sulfurimonas sp.]|uniref:sensor domain-containing protein n=1 Tax=Sulfurimonas sp. TaxID=2022749 RepID=UPI0028CEF78B|nr:EAL domain-containing protein [Sulfurimonas sp.]MDT8338425.1 EAL domain-containing protein [Sulfurimonas sp.]